MGGGATLDVVNVRAGLGDDQGSLKLPHVLGVDPEVRLEPHLDVNAFGHVHERSAGPHRGVQCRELVVVGRDDGREVLTHDVPVLAQRRVHVREDHTLLLEILVNLVLSDFCLVLRTDPGQELSLRLGNAQTIKKFA